MCSMMLMSFLNDESGKLLNDKEGSKEKIFSILLQSVEKCKTRFGGKSELATDSCDDVNQLCLSWEALFLHGLKRNVQIGKLSFLTSSASNSLHSICWNYISKNLLNKYEISRFVNLNLAPVDLVRAWIRNCLNEHSLEKYVLIILTTNGILSTMYETWALFRDNEKSAILQKCAADLKSIIFACTIKRNKEKYEKETTQNSIIKKDDTLLVSPNIVPTVKLNKQYQGKVYFDDDFGDSSSGRSSPSSNLSCNIMSKKQSKKSHNRSSSLDLNKLRLDKKPIPTVSQGLDDIKKQSYEALFSSYGKEEIEEESDIITPVSPNSESPCLLPIVQNANNFPANNNQFNNKISQKPLQNNNSSLTRSHSYDKLSHEDLRQAVIDMMMRKDDAEKHVEELTATLNSRQDEMFCLHGQLAKLKNDNLLEKNKLADENSALKLENDLLKLQLKKYVSAVQMLRGGVSINQLPVHVPEVVPIPPNLSAAYVEMEEYEKKLIEIADMHGELMEFNEYLQKQINSKEHSIRQLRNELTSLRGPLMAHENSESDLEELSNSTLVNIWIPCAFLKNPSSPKAHHVYQIFVRIKDDEWNVYRRYAEFYNLQQALRKQRNNLMAIEFPAKKTFGNKQIDFVEIRRKKLEAWLRLVLNMVLSGIRNSLNKEELCKILPFLSTVDEKVMIKRKRTKSVNVD